MRKALWVPGIVLLAFVAALRATAVLIESRYNRVRTAPPYTTSDAIRNLHQSLVIADLHADSLLWGRNLLQRSGTGHVDIPRLQQAHVFFQAFTIVTTIPRNLNIERNSTNSDLVRYLALADGWPTATWNSPKARALYQAKRLREFEANSEGKLRILRSRSNLQEAIRSNQPGQIVSILGAEGAQPLEGRLENLDELYAAGFRMMSPTHFTDTAVAGSASGLRKSGLSELGRSWVRAMESRKMLIDVAHASRATLLDVTAMATRPVVVSHTGVRGTCNNNRNLGDDELRAVARTGGLVGIGYWETSVCGRDARAVVRAIRYASNIIGVEHVCLGSDFDGGTTMPFDVTGVVLITSALQQDGFSDREIRLIMGQNVIRLLTQVLPD